MPASSWFAHIATWSPENGLKIKNGILGSLFIKSLCSEPCPPGHYAIIDTPKNCCWACVLCPYYHFKNTEGQHLCQIRPKENDFYTNLNKADCIKLKRIYWSFNQKEQSLSVVFMVCFSIFDALTTSFFMLILILKKDTSIVR